MMRLLIGGDTAFEDYDLLYEKTDNLLRNRQDEEIIIITTGEAGSAHFAEIYANERGYEVKQFPAEWGRLQNIAGTIRNKDMAMYATHAIIFWDKHNHGTTDLIRHVYMYIAPEKYRVVHYTPNYKTKGRR